MLIVLLVIFIITFTFGAISCDSWDFEGLGAVITIGSGMALVAVIVGFIVASCTAAGSITYDDKIAMYQKENAKIEAQIAEVVENYQKYETDIFTNIKPESSMILVSMYPELKSDKLVEGQINTYIKNNDKIKELKELKIDAKLARWWLYFGG